MRIANKMFMAEKDNIVNAAGTSGGMVAQCFGSERLEAFKGWFGAEPSWRVVAIACKQNGWKLISIKGPAR